MSQPNLLNQLKLSLAEFWSVRDGRERKILAIAAMLVALSLIYILLIAPTVTGRELLRKNLPTLREQAVQMQALAKEASNYAERTPPTVTALSQSNVEAALARSGLKPKSLTVTGEFAQVQLTDVSFSSIIVWLSDLQKIALASVSEVTITALTQPDKVDAKITLQQHRNQ